MSRIGDLLSDLPSELVFAQADLTLRGFGGYNTRCALKIAPDIFPRDTARPAELVTLWFGKLGSDKPLSFRFWITRFEVSNECDSAQVLMMLQFQGD